MSSYLDEQTFKNDRSGTPTMETSLIYAENRNPYFVEKGIRLRHKANLPLIPCLGDSITYGLCVTSKETYPAILDRMVTHTSFANMGCPGGGVRVIENHVKIFLENNLTKKPLCFILQIPNFDRRPHPNIPAEAGVNDYTFHHGVVNAYKSGFPIDDAIAESLMKEEMRDLIHLLEKLDRIGQERTLAVVYPYKSMDCPPIDALSDTWFSWVSSYLKETNHVCVSMPRFDLNPSDDRVGPKDVHLSATGHKKLAQNILDNMFTFDAL
jgi:lysophospholipase L1-like esterase